MFGLPVAEPCRYPSEVAHRRQPQIVASSDTDHRCLLEGPLDRADAIGTVLEPGRDVSRIRCESVRAQVTGGPRDCHRGFVPLKAWMSSAGSSVLKTPRRSSSGSAWVIGRFSSSTTSLPSSEYCPMATS